MVLLSGGVDSATCLYLMTRRGYATRAMTFVFHGIARREIEAARLVAHSAGAKEHRFVNLPDLRESGDIDGARFPGLPPTYIPLRNLVYYALAASYAEETKAVRIVGGHNAEDQKVFKDTRDAFFEQMQRAIWSGSLILAKRKTRIERPLRMTSRSGVVKMASRLRVPLELTWSCHEDGSAPCWKCTGCVERAERFAAAGVADPLRPPK